MAGGRSAQPSADLSPEVRAAAQQASTEAFHLAMLVAVGLLMAGAAVTGLGIRNPAAAGRRLGPGPQQPQADRTAPANRRVHPAHGPGRR
jgi:hypothetical protein